MSEMIRVEIVGAVRPDVWEWRVDIARGVASGRSRQPLLSACRELKRMGEDTGREIGLFWPGRLDWSLKTRIGVGADLTVSDPPSGKGVGFRKFIADPRWEEE